MEIAFIQIEDLLWHTVWHLQSAVWQKRNKLESFVRFLELDWMSRVDTLLLNFGCGMLWSSLALPLPELKSKPNLPVALHRSDRVQVMDECFTEMELHLSTEQEKVKDAGSTGRPVANLVVYLDMRGR